MNAPASHERSFLRRLLGPRFVLTFIAIEVLRHLLAESTPLERAQLGGFDSLAYWAERLRGADTINTVIVGITAEDVERHFEGRRPVPPRRLIGVVDSLLALNPTVLVVDVFTEDSAYARSGLLDGVRDDSLRLVWAQAVDTATSAVLSVLGGVRPLPGRPGLAAVMLDHDFLTRRVRPRFESTGPEAVPGGLESLPLAAVVRCQEVSDACGYAHDVAEDDTGSVALRIYPREPAMYVLSDVLAAAAGSASAKSSPLAGKLVVLGFVDGSDQVATPWGVRAGPFLVADAIQTLLDPRGVVREPPFPEIFLDFGLAILILLIHARIRRPAVTALAMVTLTGVTFGFAVLAFATLGFWTNPILIIVGIWLEQLTEAAMEHQHA